MESGVLCLESFQYKNGRVGLSLFRLTTLESTYMARITLIVLALLAMPAHANLGEQSAEKVLIQIAWVANNKELYSKAAEVGACQGTGICKGFSQRAKTESGVWICLITMVKPADWDNNSQLAVLGHETLHCFGYEHEH